MRGGQVKLQAAHLSNSRLLFILPTPLTVGDELEMEIVSESTRFRVRGRVQSVACEERGYSGEISLHCDADTRALLTEALAPRA